MLGDNLPTIIEVQALKTPQTLYTGTIRINTDTITERKVIIKNNNHENTRNKRRFLRDQSR